MGSIQFCVLLSLTAGILQAIRTDGGEDNEKNIQNQPKDWTFDKAILLHQVNRTVVQSTDKGLLVANLIGKSREEMNATVCSDNFNWWTANTFCHYFGHKQGEWSSGSRDSKIVTESWSRNNTIGSVLLSDISCKHNDDEVTDCNAQAVEHSCDYDQRVWLNCSDGEDKWNDVLFYKNIPADLETSLLHVKTDGVEGSGDYTLIQYYDDYADEAGGVGILFSSPVKYNLLNCQHPTTFPISPSKEQENHWVIQKRGNRTVMHCNGELVLNITASNETCDDPDYTVIWATYWKREMSKIQFHSAHSYNATDASNSYCIERLLEYQSANLINMISRPVKETGNQGLLIVTIKNKQTGIKQNGTVCKDAFNWYSARLFCWNIGYHFADWGSYPRNLKYISGDLLNRRVGPIGMDDVSCKQNDTEISMCSSRIVAHYCQDRDNIWLNCFNSTGFQA